MDYKNKKWERKRKAILARDKYTCQYFKRYGKIKEANTVHHIFPVEFYPEYAFCNWNLISLSNEAHNKMHDRDTHEITAAGRELQARVYRDRLEFDQRQSPPVR